MKMPGVTSVLKAVSRAYPFPGNIWSASRHIRPEMLSVPLHQMMRQPTPRCGAATFLSRCFSSALGDGLFGRGGIIRPEQIVPAGIIQPEGAVFSSSRALSSGTSTLRGGPWGVIRPEQIVRTAGIIQPEGSVFSSSRSLSSGTSTLDRFFYDTYECKFDSNVPRLPVVRQTSFFELQDTDMCEDPITFLRRTHIVREVQNQLIDNPELEPRMLNCIGKKLWRSAVLLVSANRRRGYCIANALVEKNMVVSSNYGTFGLKSAIAEDISGHLKSDFKGYKQVNLLFETLMKKAYGDGILEDISPDIDDYQRVLETSVYDDRLPVYHASMLARPGRAWLSIRLASILRGEMRSAVGPDIGVENSLALILENIPYSTCSVEEMHKFFGIWINHYEDQRQNKQPILLEPEDQEFSDRVTAGLRIVALNRNGILHPYGKELSAVRRARTYKVQDVVGLMHCKMPLYLPHLQSMFLDEGRWDWLDMQYCFPEEIHLP